jgi:hypothetical protein
LNRQLEHCPRVVLEDLLAILGAQPLDAFDHHFDVVHGVAGSGVDRRADAGAFGAEQAAVDADSLDQQAERVLGVDKRRFCETIDPCVLPAIA